MTKNGILLFIALLFSQCTKDVENKVDAQTASAVTVTASTVLVPDTIRGSISIKSSNVIIENKVIIGSDRNTLEHGIKLASQKALSNITIRNCEIYGFGGSGIYLNYAITNLTIDNVKVHDNRIAGIYISSKWDGTKFLKSNKNVIIKNSKAYNNTGLLTYTTNWSGSGILVEGVVGGRITNCEAFSNGINNGSKTNGPVGIWVDNATNYIIETSESHHNLGGPAKKDGGGFDIDGGSEGCIIRNCISYNNQGPGYSFFNWATANPWKGNKIEDCESKNDASNTGYGSFSVWGSSSSYKVVDGSFNRNKIIKSNGGVAIKFLNSNHMGTGITNNTITLTGTSKLGTIPTTVSFLNNIVN